MKLTEDNYYVLLREKHERLTKALYRAEDLHKKYIDELNMFRDMGFEWEEMKDWDFNLLYDLIDRLKDRLHRNNMVLGDWNFVVHGCNIITFK